MYSPSCPKCEKHSLRRKCLVEPKYELIPWDLLTWIKKTNSAFFICTQAITLNPNIALPEPVYN